VYRVGWRRGRLFGVDALQVLGGRYRLEERLGVGGMSVVWRGFDLVLGRAVAVKVLSGRYATDDSFRESIRTEAQAAARVSHPHLASVHDYGESLDAEGRRVPYVVMELLSGSTLIERLAQGPLPPRAGLLICAEVAEALAAVHAHQLVHRDVKPGNVMLTSVGAKLVDFGVAAVAGEASDAGPDGRIMGTPNYVAPERLLGGPVEPASDVYGLGLLVFRVLTGKLPWPSGAPSLAARADPAPLPAVDGVPGEVGELYLRCVAMQAHKRPSAGDAAGLLMAAVHSMPPDPERDDDTSLVAGVTPSASTGVVVSNGHQDETTVANRKPRVAAMAVSAAAAAVVTLLIVTQAGRAGSDPSGAAPGATATATSTVTTGPGPSAAGDPTGDATPFPPPGPGHPGNGPGIGAGGTPGTTTSAVTPTPTPTLTTLNSIGGSVQATCYGELAYLDDWQPAAGFTVVRVEQGPAPQTGIVFRSADTQVRMVVRCVDGRPQARTATEPARTRSPSPSAAPAAP
jgi:eukaryotic-like serine/threonine-protein kinase